MKATLPRPWVRHAHSTELAVTITAAGAGSAAAIALNADLVDEDVLGAVRDLDHGFALAPTTNSHQESA